MIIYAITNTINGRRYIGQTIQNNLHRRWSDHCSRLRRETHFNAHLQSAWKKYGADAFTIEALDSASSIEKLNILEERYRQKFYPNVYNMKEGGRNAKPTLETRSKMRATHLRADSNSYKKGYIPWNKGKVGLQTAWNKGKKTPSEVCKKISESRQGIEPWNKGKKTGQIPWNKGIRWHKSKTKA